MSAINKELKDVWEALRDEYRRYDHFLTEIEIHNMRGIKSLRVPFRYPVTVLAGENSCGKTTVLLGCAAAYKNKQGTPENYFRFPASTFPAYIKDGMDTMQGAELQYTYITQGQGIEMKWKRGKSWNRSFYGRKGAAQPEREVYLRTLASMTNPAEVRALLQIKRGDHVVSEVPYETLVLSRRVLPFEYESVHKAEKSKGKGDLLLAKLKNGMGEYSEFHMAAGERAILRLSMEVAGLEDALVLIDEVETGLHPHIQKLLMLNLQSMAMRQNLQIIVTTHSPVVLDCVPPDGRIFLERDKQTHDVRVVDPLRDVMQRIMYGQADDKLSIICEDVIAEAVIRGVVDALSRKINFMPDQISVGRDTGVGAFPHHVRTMAMMGKLPDVLFVLDGDARGKKGKVEKAAGDGGTAKVLVLPGEGSPEEWLWREMSERSEECGELVALPKLPEYMAQAERTIAGGTGSRREKYKALLLDLSLTTECDSADVARRVARHLAEKRRGEIVQFLDDLRDAIQKWRRLNID